VGTPARWNSRFSIRNRPRGLGQVVFDVGEVAVVHIDAAPVDVEAGTAV